MSKETFKQKILKGIEELPLDASLDEIMLEIFNIHTSETNVVQNEILSLKELENLLKEIERN